MAIVSEVKYGQIQQGFRWDSEHYRQDYIAQQRALLKFKTAPLQEIAQISDGNHLSIKGSFTDSGVRYLRGQDLSDFFISNEAPVYIPDYVYDRLSRSHILPGDVLIGIVGTIGSIAVVPPDAGRLTGNCKMAIVRSKSLPSNYIAAYLASSSGQNELARRTRGSVQMGLTLPDIKDIPIPLLPLTDILHVSALLDRAYDLRIKSVKQYEEASAVFMRVLGIDLPVMRPSLFTEHPFSVVRQAGRMDAEYFQHEFTVVRDAIRASDPMKIIPMEDILREVCNGHTPLRHDLSVGEIPFLTAENVHDFKIDFIHTKRITRAHHETELSRTSVRNGDVLITIKGRVGNSVVVEDFDSTANINQDLAILRVASHIPLYFLVGYLNSPVGKALTSQIGTGQINPFLSLANLKRLPIPIYDSPRMEQISSMIRDLIFDSKRSDSKSRETLLEARSYIDHAICSRM